MKRLKIFLLLLPMALCSAGPLVTPLQPGTQDGYGILLVYAGTMKGAINLNINMHVEIDSSVGVRYELAFDRGGNVMAHTALFYKFSDPQETILYNFLTHESTNNYCCGSSDDASNVKVVGNDIVDSLPCTHLQGINNSESGAEDYWVSTAVPGYSKLLTILNSVSPGLQQMVISGTIFEYGGLVKMTQNVHNRESAEVHLMEADSTMTFPATDFDVPSN
jgi:hypothetical protein